MQIISRQETVNIALKNKTLHQWMCFEAENIIKHSWCDVAVHDKRKLDKMRAGETRLWIISELGSSFLPMYCRLNEKHKQEECEYSFSSVEVHMMRFMKDDRLGSAQSKLARSMSKFYFITKGDSDYNYSVTATTFEEVADLVFCGKANHLLKYL